MAAGLFASFRSKIESDRIIASSLHGLQAWILVKVSGSKLFAPLLDVWVLMLDVVRSWPYALPTVSAGNSTKVFSGRHLPSAHVFSRGSNKPHVAA